MPFINIKYSAEITAEQEDTIKKTLGKAIEILGKTEDWLMVGFEQNCSLYFRGEKSEKIAFVEVSLLGDAKLGFYTLFNKEVSLILENVLGVPANEIYVKYSPVKCWGLGQNILSVE